MSIKELKMKVYFIIFAFLWVLPPFFLARGDSVQAGLGMKVREVEVRREIKREVKPRTKLGVWEV